MAVINIALDVQRGRGILTERMPPASGLSRSMHEVVTMLPYQLPPWGQVPARTTVAGFSSLSISSVRQSKKSARTLSSRAIA
jgi:hypothetical protein